MVGGVAAGGIVQLVTARFSFLVMHLIVTCVLVDNKMPLIQINLDPRDSEGDRTEEYENIDAWLTALLALAILFMAAEFTGVLSGYAIHQKNANIVSVAAHLVGFASTISMLLNGWTVDIYPYVFTFCSLLPAGFDSLWWAFRSCTQKARPR